MPDFFRCYAFRYRRDALPSPFTLDMLCYAIVDIAMLISCRERADATSHTPDDTDMPPVSFVLFRLIR